MTITNGPMKGRSALVLGGGIAGLAAAGVLARHFEQVTVVEQDRYPASREVRPHTPHGAHPHVLLAGGLVALVRLIPQLPAWLDEMGVPLCDLTDHTRAAFEGRWLPRARSGIPIRLCTRSDVEHLLLRHVSSLGNAQMIDGCKVLGLAGSGGDGRGALSRVRGARVSRDGSEEELTADLVVDAMGRGSPAARWLTDAGARIEEEVVDGGILYCSAWFSAPAGIDDDWVALLTLPSIPTQTRLGFLLRFPDDRMLGCVVEYGKPKAARTTDELIARIESLSVPHLHRVLRAARPMSEVAAYGNTGNRWRRYGRLDRFPDGLLVIGDALCSLNPRYGQGMTVASIGAEHLHKELSSYSARHGGLDGFSRHFQKGMDRLLVVPWQIALMEDTAWVSHLAGVDLSLAQRLVLAGSQRVLRTAFSDIDTYIRFMRVAQMLDGPTAMLAPRTLARIARGPRSGPTADHAPGIGPC